MSDLNPIRAGLAPTLEESQFTSVQRRIQSLEQESQVSPSPVQFDQVYSSDEASAVESITLPEPTASAREGRDPARFLAPLTMTSGTIRSALTWPIREPRCSNKGLSFDAG